MAKISLKSIVSRLTSPTSVTGRVIQGVGTIIGVGGAAATQVGMFELTGDRVVDLAIILCTTLVLLFGGQLQVEEKK